jgi:diaminopimelate epimerase
MKFYKYHALGNDYIVVDPKTNSIDLTPQAIERICHRNFGVGSDGILHGPIYKQNKLGLRIFNPDGSEAEKSGNGIRIFSRYLVESGYVRDQTFTLNTLGGEVQVEVLKPDGSLSKVDMGEVIFRSDHIPVRGEPREVVDEVVAVDGSNYRVTCVSVGNPHCVIPMETISKELALRIGPQIENHPLFPNRINMQLLQVIDRRNIQIEIWERGAGYTLASGSSSCAAAGAAYKLGLVDRALSVHMPGGTLEIEIRRDGHVYQQGGVSSVAFGELSEEFVRSL